MIKTIYAMSLVAQEPEITEYCFGKCKKILVGCIDIMGGTFMCCNSKACAYAEKEEYFEDFDVTIRKLDGICHDELPGAVG